MAMELLAPAGNLQKLEYAYRYGADAAYFGVGTYSLRQKADNFTADDIPRLRELKKSLGGRKLYCALNIFFHQSNLQGLEKNFEELTEFPMDAWIISDPGLLPLFRRRLPGAELHLSTQANCLNSEAVKVYRDLGFSRVILGREVPLRDIEAIKGAVPEMELEVFVHGAMCLAYSGRCFLSRWMADRSANQGICAHSCRWEYRVLEERERPGEYYPIEEHGDYTTLLSSRDLCMIDHLSELKEAGVDSLKIEGRMKSLYYTALVTRAYRKRLDALNDPPPPDSPRAQELAGFREDLFRVSHREYSTGFFFGRGDIERPTEASYARSYLLLGTVGPPLRAPGTQGPEDQGEWRLRVNNKIRTGSEIEYVGPDILARRDSRFMLRDEEGAAVEEADHGRGTYSVEPSVPVEEGFILRRKN